MLSHLRGTVGRASSSSATATATAATAATAAAAAVVGGNQAARSFAYRKPALTKKAPNDAIRGKKGQPPKEYPPLPDGKVNGLAWPPPNTTIYNRAKKVFKYEMHDVRKQYQEEYREWKEHHDAEKAKRWQKIVEKKAAHKAKRKIQRAYVRAEEEKKHAKFMKEKAIEAIQWRENRLATEKKRYDEGMHQLEYMLEEREKNWVLDFDTDIKGDTLFDTRYELTGFWVKPLNKTKPKTTVMNLLEDKHQGPKSLEFDSDDERDMLDFEKINQKRFALGHLPGAK